MDRTQAKKINQSGSITGQNLISEVAKARGMKSLRPDDSILEKMGIKVHTWNKWWNKKSDPDFAQTIIISKEILHCEPGDLFPSEGMTDEDKIASRHNLVSPGA